MALIEEAIAKTVMKAPAVYVSGSATCPVTENSEGLLIADIDLALASGLFAVAVSVPAMTHNCSCARTRNLCLTFSLR